MSEESKDKLASGGIVGEGGPEQIYLGSGTQIYSNNDSKKMMGGVITNHINVPISRSSGYTLPKSRRLIAGEVFKALNSPPKPGVRTIVVDKRTHRIRFENETENEVTIVIEPKENEF
jgi:hypothetical protein